jgi:hypothetical protein
MDDIDFLIKEINNNKNSIARMHAIDKLGILKNPKTIDFLIMLSKDNDPYICYHATESLSKFGDSKVLEPLIDAFNSMSKRYLKRHIFKSISNIKSPEVIEFYKQFIYNFKNDYEHDAAEILDKLLWKPKNDIEKSYYLISKHQWGDLIPLGNIAVKPLIEYLKSNNTYCYREHSAEILGIIKDERAVIPLIEALKDKNNSVKVKVLKALIKIGKTSCIEVIINNLFDTVDFDYIDFYSIYRNNEQFQNDLKKLFFDYSEFIIIPAITIIEDRHYEKYIEKLHSIILELSKINTQISVNILYKISRRKNIEVIYEIISDDPTDKDTYYENKSIDLGFIRETAFRELEKLGNPLYDSSAYYNINNWRI